MTHPPKDTSDALHPMLDSLRGNRPPPDDPRGRLAFKIATAHAITFNLSSGEPWLKVMTDSEREMICVALAPKDTSDAAAMLALADEIEKTVSKQKADGWPVCLTLSDGRVAQIVSALRTAASRPPAERDALRLALTKTRTNLVGLSQSDNDVFASMIRRIDKALGV